MAKPIATKTGICFAFPDVLLTPAPPAPDIPIPYPNIAQLSAANNASENVNAGGKNVITEASEIPKPTSGGEPGVNGGVKDAGKHLDACTFPEFSGTVKANGNGIVRQFDRTDQNGTNAVGMVMVGNPTVLVGD